MIIQIISSHEIINDEESDLLMSSESLSVKDLNLLDLDVPTETVTYQLK